MLDMEQQVLQQKQRKAPGRPFLPGQCGNPKGRPPGARRLVARALLAPHAETFAAALLDLATSAKDEVRLEAIKLALAYFSGPPPNIPQKENEPDAATSAAAAVNAIVEARRVLEATP